MKQHAMSILVAAADSTDSAKAAADIVCTGVHDEVTIQAALDKAVTEDKHLELFNGVYHVDGFRDFGDQGPMTALCAPNPWKETVILGQTAEYGHQHSFRNGVVLLVSAQALETVTHGADVFRSAWTKRGIQNGSSLRMENISVVLANNQHPVRCIDLRRTDRVKLQNMNLIAYGDQFEGEGTGLGIAPEIPGKGCIGLTMTDGSNDSYCDYVNVQTYGFDEGIQVGGEHAILINCGAAIGNYGFTFGNYESNCGTNHPITLINCMDESNIHMPLFRWCGDHDPRGNRLQGLQEITFINFNMERVALQTPGGKLGDAMREIYPGTFRGRMEVTVQPAWNHRNAVDCQLWENDGSGTGIITRNSAHRQICSTAERLSYYPTYGQQVFDTDLNKMLICTDPAARKWVDFLGNEMKVRQ